jgi:hypothetical protein
MLTGAVAWVTSIDALSEGYVFLLAGIFLSFYLGYKAKPWQELGDGFIQQKYIPFMLRYFIPFVLMFLWANGVGILDLFIK